MNHAQLLAEGAILLVIGMTTVFAFLLLMVAIMTALRKPVAALSHLLPDPQPAQAKKPAPPAADDNAQIALAIAAALKR
ncbi:MAG: OadG family protein [Kiritimatiellaeota bacterium]|nr:OadG family protein [Kiritimatiellota bacterium]